LAIAAVDEAEVSSKWAARLLDRSEQDVWYLQKRGRLRAHKDVYGRLRYSVHSIAALLVERKGRHDQ
jgi:hypothetical protein